MLKNFISFLMFAFTLTTTQRVVGQELLGKVPTTKEEFVASEKNVLATIEWLENTPFESEAEKRTQQKTLLITWLTNSPTVSLELNGEILTFIDKNPDLMVIFMGGYTRFALQNNYSSDNVQCSIAGIKSAIKVYKSQSLKKDKEMDKLVKLDDKGKLEQWVKDKLSKK